MKRALFLVSAAVISYQLLLVHNLSITQWYHFASMIISVALLGFGASGSFLTLFRKRIIANTESWYFIFICLTALFMIISFRLIQLQTFSFDSYLVFSSWSDMSRLLITYLLLFIPFFFAAIAIGLLFTTYPDQIGNLYFINLIGSGAGGLLLLFILTYLTPQQSIACIVFLSVIASFFAIPVNIREDHQFYKLKTRKRRYHICSLIILLIAIINYIYPPQLYVSEFKSLSKVLNLPESEIVTEKSSPYGLLQVVESLYIRYAPGLSLNYKGESGIEKVVFNNGNWVGPLFSTDKTTDYFTHSTLYLPHIIQDNNEVLVLEAGTGEGVEISLLNDVSKITAIESNTTIIDYIQNDHSNSGELFNHPDVTVIDEDPYAYLFTVEDSYDLIHLPLYDSFGGVSGINAISEKPLLSKESFQRMWDSLNDNGMITISTWIDSPLRYPLRVLATITEMLNYNDIVDTDKHIVAIRNWSLITFVATKNQIDEQQIKRVREFCEENLFDMLLLPSLHEDEREKYNLLTDKSLFDYTDQILANHEQRNQLYTDYILKIEPVSEDRPFPFQFLKITRINELLQQYTLFDIPYLEIGYSLIAITFIKVVLLAVLFIMLPLMITLKMSSGKSRTFIYFFALGLGFLMVEIVLIQRFISYLGTPLYSSAVIISGILVFSGIGSKFSGKINSLLVATKNKSVQNLSKMEYMSSNGNQSNNKTFIIIFTLIITFIIMYLLFLNPVLNITINFPFGIKVILTFLFIAPLAFLMGFPFPMGISHINQTGNKNNISWAWGINGSISVISSILATIIAIEFGFTLVKATAALSYLFALISVLIFKE